MGQRFAWAVGIAPPDVGIWRLTQFKTCGLKWKAETRISVHTPLQPANQAVVLGMRADPEPLYGIAVFNG